MNNKSTSNNSKQELTFVNKVVIQNIDGFVRTLKKKYNNIKNVTAPFHNVIKNILEPYSGVGFTILMNFEEEIKLCLKREIPN
nr:3136_t:CDS:2 [Entrophospora candida]